MATTFTVTNLNDSDTGSLRHNLYLAHITPGADVITFDPSLQGQTIDLSTETLNVGSDVTIDGDLDNDGNPDITINANRQFRVFNVDDGNGTADKNVVFDGLTITGGRTNNPGSFGAGIRNLENLEVRNSVISDNATFADSSGGGGIFNDGGELTVSNSLVLFNSTNGDESHGGGIYNHSGNLMIRSSAIDINATTGELSTGGGVHVHHGDAVTILNSTISSNTTFGRRSFGGGISNFYSHNLKIQNSTVSDNSVYGRASAGGGISSLALYTTVQNSTITGNTASGTYTYGGGVVQHTGSLIVENSIIAGNASTRPIAIDIYSTFGLIEVSHSLLGDSSKTTKESIADTIDGDNNILATIDGTHPTALEDILAPRADNGGSTYTYALVPGSPAIDAGNNLNVPADLADQDGDRNTDEATPFDQRGSGFGRVSGRAVDLGAFEFQYTPEIDLEVFIYGVAADTASDAMQITVGESITYTYRLENTGDVSMDNITVLDDGGTVDFSDDLFWAVQTASVSQDGISFTGGDDGDWVLEPGEIWEFTSIQSAREGAVEHLVDAGATESASLLYAVDRDTSHYVGILPVVSITANSATVEEGEASTFTLSRDTTAGDLTVALFLNPGAGLNPSDFTLSGNIISQTNMAVTVLIPDGSSSVDLTFAATDDLPAEALESLTVTVTGTPSYDVNSGASSAAIAITANDTVVTNTNDSGEGSLRQAILNANANPGADIITFEGSVFSDDTPDTITLIGGELAITDDLEIQGLGADLLTIDAAQKSRVFFIDSADEAIAVTLDSLTITGGVASLGGGILSNEDLTISNSIIRDNASTITGGGIFNRGGLTVSNSTFSGNSANASNSFAIGGGIRNDGTLRIDSSTFSDNSADFGGGIYNRGTLTLSNGTLSNNSATYSGGGIANWGALAIHNSTLSGNSANRSGGGIFDGTSQDRQKVLASTIVAANTAGFGAADISGGSTYTSGGHNLLGLMDVDGFTDGANGDKVGVTDPGLAPLADNGGPTQTMALLPDSIAINAGSNPDGLNTDQRGGTRSFGQTDIGAFEWQLTVNGKTVTGYVDSAGNLAGRVFNVGQTYTGNMASSTDDTDNPDDVLLGTDADDNIWAGTQGNDTIAAGAGNDTIGFGAGNAWVDAGAGNDTVYAAGTSYGGDNVFHLGEGNNSIHLEGGNNTITAGGGNDSIGLGTGTDTVYAGDGNNMISLAKPNDPAGDKDIITGMGNDLVQAGAGSDRLNLGTNAGGNGDFDRAYGRGGSDIFVLNPGSGWLTVGDFAPEEDQLELQGMTFADVQQTVASGHTQIWAGSDLLAELEGFAGTLTESNFVTSIS